MENIKEIIAELIAKITHHFVTAFFIMWGWNTLAPHINAPTFTFLEVFAMRMGFSYLMAIVWQRPSFKKDEKKA